MLGVTPTTAEPLQQNKMVSGFAGSYHRGASFGAAAPVLGRRRIVGSAVK